MFVSSTLSDLTAYSQTSCLLATLVLVTAISWLRDMHQLRFTSMFGIIALLLSLLATSIEASETRNPTPADRLPLFEASTFGVFLGNTAFLYLISTAILPIYQSIQQPEHFESAFVYSVVAVTVVNVVFALYAWSRFGHCTDGTDECIQDSVIRNLPNSNVSSKVVKFLLCIDLIFTSVLFLYPLNTAIEHELLFVNASASTLTTNISRSVMASAVALVAYTVPNFGLLTGKNLLNRCTCMSACRAYWRIREQYPRTYTSSKCS